MQDWLSRVKGLLLNEIKERPAAFDLQDSKLLVWGCPWLLLAVGLWLKREFTEASS